MLEKYINEYIFSGSLPENASTYVIREADDELYQALQQGKFCYVLNSRQSGKSSLRVRTMSRLSEADVQCASIDLSSVSIQSATQENWYADLIVKLIDSFDLNVDFHQWWEKNKLNSSLMRFSNFLEKTLLVEIQENIVIFIDEIDSVLSLNFPTDDFFAFIRSCYNQRVDNPEYNRLTFCLLGVASPSNLIEDKQRTPFNIGTAISLKGFQLHEVEPLQLGLEGKFTKPQAVMQEILEWTEGQPFLTQKLCQLMVEESEKENPLSVKHVVKSRIIENWESQDEPEHLRTIQARLLRDEQRAGYLLELYQQIRLAENKYEIIADDTLEQSELQLSGLIVRQQNKLKVYNPIYKEVFDSNWIETQLKNLRPYSENFRVWMASGGTDKSRLLRGKALHDALEWSKNKSLSYQDRQFLAASLSEEREEEIAALEQEAALKRERQDREAAEKRNQVLSEANNKAQQRISIGTVILIFTLVITAISGILAGKEVVIARNAREEAKKAQQEVAYAKIEIKQTKQQIENVSKLSALGGELYKANNQFQAEQAWRRASLSFEIRDYKLKQAMLLSNISVAYEQLGKLTEANKAASDSLKLLQTDVEKKNSADRLVILAQALNIKGRLLASQGNTKDALEASTEAFNSLQSLGNDLTSISPGIQVTFAETVESVYRGLIGSLLQPKETLPNQQNLKKARQLIESLHFTELNNFSQLAPLNTNLREIDEIDPKAAVIYPIVLDDRLEIILHLPRQPLRRYSINSSVKEVVEIKEVAEIIITKISEMEALLPYTSLAKASEKVYNWLIRPIEADLVRSRSTTLVFVLDGYLQYIPIAALYDSKSKQYLVQKYAIALTPGLQLLNPKPLPKRKLQILTAGISQARKSFPAVPGVEEELKKISSMAKSKVLLNQNFTSKAIQEQIKSQPYNIIHLAGHGQFSSDPEETFILAWDKQIKANELSELLQSREQTGQEAVELLVLSAGPTASGDNKAPFGLAGVAVRSGARSTLASLWNLNDESTALLMSQFYRELTKTSGIAKAEALRRAQLQLASSPEYSYPIFWASFVLIGDWR